MNLDKIANIFGAIVVVAGITALVTSRNTAGIINSLGGFFIGSIRAALGK